MQVHSLPADSLHGKSIHLRGDEARHILKVLRMGKGQELLFSDGRGRFLHARIDRCSATELHAMVGRVEEDARETDAPRSTLALALLKGDHFELAVEKCTELGVHRVVPVLAERSVVRWKPGERKKLERWARIADSAMKQSGRSWRPEILDPLSLEDLVQRFSDCRLVVADEEEPGRSAEAVKLEETEPYVGLVGPEGAFSPREKQVLEEAGATPVSLSPYRLRSETAAMALIATLNGRTCRG